MSDYSKTVDEIFALVKTLVSVLDKFISKDKDKSARIAELEAQIAAAPAQNLAPLLDIQNELQNITDLVLSASNGEDVAPTPPAPVEPVPGEPAPVPPVTPEAPAVPAEPVPAPNGGVVIDGEPVPVDVPPADGGII